jgi:hypothetical protein
MARPQNSKPLSVRSTCGSPRVIANPSRTRVTETPPSARGGTTATASGGRVDDDRQTNQHAALGRALEHDLVNDIRYVPPTRASRWWTFPVNPLGGRHLTIASASRNARQIRSGVARSTRRSRIVFGMTVLRRLDLVGPARIYLPVEQECLDSTGVPLSSFAPIVCGPPGGTRCSVMRRRPQE